MYNHKLKILLSIISLSVFAYANAADLPIPTQIPDLEEQISTDVSPSSPKPGEEITITLSAFGTDLNASNISWAVNGATVKSGKGERILKVKMGKAGTAMRITAVIEPLNGNTITKIFTINPATVDLLWEARTYTPPFYKGKALFSPQENVVFVAMPNIINTNGVKSNPSKITYTWRQDTRVEGDRSGYGVNSFAYKGRILASPVIINVEATDESGLTAQSHISLAPTDTIMGLYEDSPLYGMLFNTELSGGFDFGNKEERTLAAYPYYFGINGKSDESLSYMWTINGTQINVPEYQNEMTLRNTAGEAGISIIGSSITSNSNILESSDTQTSVNFAKPASKIFPR